MRMIHTTGLDPEDELDNYELRQSVQGLRCDDGVIVADEEGNPLASHEAPCVLIVDGDDFQPVPAEVFDALYRNTGPAQRPAAQESVQPAPEPAPQPAGAGPGNAPPPYAPPAY